MTTRYDEADFLTSVPWRPHETGHALYEMGLPIASAGPPASRRRAGMGLHESQSPLMEMQAAHARSSWALLPVRSRPGIWGPPRPTCSRGKR